MDSYQILIRLFTLVLPISGVANCYGQSIPCNAPYGHAEVELTMLDTITTKVIGNQTIHVFFEAINYSSYYVKLPERSLHDGIYQTYFSADTNQIAVKVSYKDSVKHGYERKYHLNGQLRVATPFQNGIKDGTAVGYYEDGSIESEIRYRSGNIDYEKQYTQDGQLWYRFENNITTYWDNKGKLVSIRYTKGDTSISEKDWFPNGQLKYVEIRFNDTETHQSYYSNGKLKLQESFLTIKEENCHSKLVKHGLSNKWKRNGKLKSTETFSYGKPIND